MRNKLTLLAMLAITGMSASALLFSARPADAVEAPAVFECTNTSCYGQPVCNYSKGENCFLMPGGCDGNEFCGGGS